MTTDRALWYELLAQAEDAYARAYGLLAAAARVNPTKGPEAQRIEELKALDMAAKSRRWASSWRASAETERRFNP